MVKNGIWLAALLRNVIVAVSLDVPLAPKGSMLVLGLGRVGLDCAKLAQNSGFDTVYGTVRLSTGAGNNSNDGKGTNDDKISRIPFETDEIRPILSKATHVLITMQQPEERDEMLEKVFADIEHHLDDISWLGLISTTGIYGNHEGNWVDEDSELLCSPGGSAARYVQYEKNWKEQVSASNAHLRIFRCSGIYDSNRSALHTVYKTGIPRNQQEVANESITNRIHSLDIARAVLSSMQDDCQDSCRIYNLADNLPESRSKVLGYAAELLVKQNISVKESPVKTAASSRDTRRTQDRKLVSNHRLLDELLQDGLLYPTYKAGLEVILEDTNAPWKIQ